MRKRFEVSQVSDGTHTSTHQSPITCDGLDLKKAKKSRAHTLTQTDGKDFRDFYHHCMDDYYFTTDEKKILGNLRMHCSEFHE